MKASHSVCLHSADNLIIIFIYRAGVLGASSDNSLRQSLIPVLKFKMPRNKEYYG